VRGKKAMEIIEKGLKVKEYELRTKCFAKEGTFGFGIQEHIDLGLKYDPAVGIFGMDFVVILRRAGERVKSRRRRPSVVGKQHRVTKEEAIQWFKDQYEGLVI